MKLKFALALVVVGSLAACSSKNGNPLSPSVVSTPVVSTAGSGTSAAPEPVIVSTSIPDAPAAPAAGQLALNCDGPVKGQEASYQWNGATVTITEHANCAADFLLAVYATPKPRTDPGFFTSQVLVSLSDVRIQPGQTVVLTPASLPECGTYQADVFRDLSADAVQAGLVSIDPQTGVNVNAYTFGDTGTVCVPPPPPVVTRTSDPCTVNCDPPPPPPPPVVDVCTNLEGNQLDIPQGYERSQAGVCTLIPPPPPPPTSCNLTAVYNGSNPFSLANSGDATELAYVQTNVSNLLSGPVKFEPNDSTSWVSDGAYPVVLVKSATSYYLYTNVTLGQVLLSQSFNSHGNRQAISHISRFSCAR